MADRSVVVRLRADVAGFTSQMRIAQQSVGDFANKTGKWAQDNKQTLNEVALKAGVAGAALTGLAGIAVARFADFDEAMSSVRAATGETADNMEKLRTAAISAGEDTKYSAVEAAAGIEELAKAGVTTQDILGGGLSGALNLAAAGEIEVAEAAETAATAMTQFGLSGEEVPRIADLLASGANKAQGGVGDLAYALKQSGLVASQFGLTIDETVGSLTAFAASGLLGSDAGTSFRTMLLRLANPSKEAKETFDELGIAAYDAEGNFVGIATLAEQLQVRMGDLSQAQRDAAFATLFGSDAIRAANVLYQEGGAGIQQWIAEVDQTGAAADTAAIRMDNLKGDLEQLSGSFETLLIGLGEGADGPLRSLVQSMTGVVNKLNELPAGAKTATLAIVGGGGFALLAAAGIAKVITLVSDTRAALQALGVTAKGTGRIIGALGKGATIAGATYLAVQASEALWDQWYRIQGLVLETDGLVEDLSIFGNTGQSVGQLKDFRGGIDGLIADLERLDSASIFSLDSFFDPNYANDLKQTKENIDAVDGALANLYETDPAAAESAFRRIRDAAVDAGFPVEELASTYFPLYSDELERAAASTEEAADESAEFNGVLPEVTESVEAQVEALQALNEQYFDLAGQFLDQREKQRRYQDALDDFTATMKDDEASQRDRARALDNVASSQLAVLEGLYAQENGVERVNRRLPAMRERLQEVANRFFGAGEKADDFVDSVLDAEGLQVEVPVSTPGADAALSRIERLRQLALVTQGALAALGRPKNGGYYEPGWADGYASGGRVIGPGGPKDDRIPAMLSNGEYVLAADAVARLGVPFLDALNAGRSYGFAQGGYVGRTASETITRSESIHIGQVVAHDYHDFRRQMDREQRVRALPGATR